MSKESKPAYRPSNPDALAIRWSLESRYDTLRGAALEIVAEVLDQTDGNLYAASEQLGIKRKTLQAWLERNDKLREVRLEAAKRRTSGRLPPELERGKR